MPEMQGGLVFMSMPYWREKKPPLGKKKLLEDIWDLIIIVNFGIWDISPTALYRKILNGLCSGHDKAGQ